MKPYSGFAEFYDSLTLNVEYKRRAEYICKVFSEMGHNMGITLDLACGTGSLTLELAKLGVDVYGVDSSEEMLAQAMNKSYAEGFNILYLKQKMQSIDLYGTIDTCVCTLDSINHLTNTADVQKTFDRVSLFLDPNGYFLFDVNTPYKHKNILADNAYIYDTDEVFCAWQNEYIGDDTVRVTLDFFSKTSLNGELYERSTETFCEKAYTCEQLTEMLAKAGMRVVSVFGDLSFDAPKNDEQRIIFVAEKVKD